MPTVTTNDVCPFCRRQLPGESDDVTLAFHVTVCKGRFYILLESGRVLRVKAPCIPPPERLGIPELVDGAVDSVWAYLAGMVDGAAVYLEGKNPPGWED